MANIQIEWVIFRNVYIYTYMHVITINEIRGHGIFFGGVMQFYHKVKPNTLRLISRTHKLSAPPSHV